MPQKCLCHVAYEVGDGGQRPAADMHVRVHRQVLVPHFDLGELYAHRVEAGAYASEELLGVAGVGEEAVDERGAVAGGEAGDVDLAERVVALDGSRRDGGRPEQSPPGAGDGGEALQRRPPQRLLLVLGLPPRPRPRERRLRRGPHLAKTLAAAGGGNGGGDRGGWWRRGFKEGRTAVAMVVEGGVGLDPPTRRIHGAPRIISLSALYGTVLLSLSLSVIVGKF